MTAKYYLGHSKGIHASLKAIVNSAALSLLGSRSDLPLECWFGWKDAEEYESDVEEHLLKALLGREDLDDGLHGWLSELIESIRDENLIDLVRTGNALDLKIVEDDYFIVTLETQNVT